MSAHSVRRPVCCDFRSICTHPEIGFAGDPLSYYEARERFCDEQVANGNNFARDDRYYLRNERLWYSLGCPDYRVYPGMAAALSRTSLDVPTSELRAPFRALTISLPPSTFFVGADLIVKETRPSLRGDPYVRAILVTEHAVTRADARYDSPDCGEGTPVLELLVDIADDDPKAPHEGVLLLPLARGKTVAECVATKVHWDREPDYAPNEEDRRRISALVVGVLFLAIANDRRYVEPERARPRPNAPCFCGSRTKFKKCCRPKGEVGRPLGFVVGREIDLPYAASSTRTLRMASGRELDYGHVRSGHMRWQPRKDATGAWVRELVFIAPTVVRPDLPLKPALTPHRVRELPMSA